MNLKDKIVAKNTKVKSNNEKGKAGINGKLQDRIENIEKYLGWRDE